MIRKELFFATLALGPLFAQTQDAAFPLPPPQSAQHRHQTMAPRTGDILTPTPFGLRFGMTAQEIIHRVGTAAIRESRGDTLVLTTAPAPHSAFDSYSLVTSPKDGLLRIDGHRNGIDTHRAGTAVDDAFVVIRDAIAVKYGPPDKAGDVPSEKKRVLLAIWLANPKLPDGMRAIVLDAEEVYSEHRGSLLLSYESNGYGAYLTSKNKATLPSGKGTSDFKTAASRWSAVEPSSGTGTMGKRSVFAPVARGGEFPGSVGMDSMMVPVVLSSKLRRR